MGMGWVSSGIAFLIGAPIAGALVEIGRDTSTGSDESVRFNFLAVQLWSGSLLVAGTGALVLMWWLIVRKRGLERVLI